MEAVNDEPLLKPSERGGAPTSRSRLLIGYVCLVLLICSWVGQSEVAQYIQTTLDYDKPYTVTWINHSVMGLILPGLWFRHPDLWTSVVREVGVPFYQVVLMCAALAVAYTLGDYLWYLALPLTSVAEATALFNSQSVFAYFFSVLVLGEAVLASKVLAVVTSIGGIVLITLSGSGSGGDGSGEAAHSAGSRLGGDLLSAGAACIYAIYEVGFKRAIGDVSDLAVVNAATGLVGGWVDCVGM